MKFGESAVILQWLMGEMENIEIGESDLLRFAMRHRVLLYPLLKHQYSRNYSSAFLQTCLDQYIENISQVEKVALFYSRFNAFLMSHPMRAIVLKGVPLSEAYYANKYHRHSRDVDILVQQEDLFVVADWLRSEGYRIETDVFSYHQKQQDIYWRHNHHFCCYGRKNELPLVVELHWRLRSNDDVCDVRLNDSFNLSLLKTSYKQLFVLNHLDQFIYLCVHGTEHGWFRMKWLLDLPLMARKVTFDWRSIQYRAKELNALEHVKVSLYLIYRLTGKSIIHDFDVRHCNISTIIKSTFIIHRMNATVFVETGYGSAIKQLLFISSFNNRVVRLSFWKKWGMSTADWKMFPLPASLFFLYYWMRPFFWVCRKAIR